MQSSSNNVILEDANSNNTQMDTSEPGGTQPPGMEDDEAAKAVAGLATSEMRSTEPEDQFEVQGGGQEQPQDLQTVLATEQLMPSQVNDSKPAEITAVAETPKTSTRGRGGKLIISLDWV